MHILFYSSVATKEVSDSEIVNILNTSRENNSQNNITGILVYQKKTREFMQILEGEKEAIFNLLDTIENDQRHTSMHLVFDEETNERYFNKWSMAFADLETIEKSKLEGISDFLEQGFTTEILNKNSANKSRLIKTFKHFIDHS
jgi:hypothetical protein